MQEKTAEQINGPLAGHAEPVPKAALLTDEDLGWRFQLMGYDRQDDEGEECFLEFRALVDAAAALAYRQGVADGRGRHQALVEAESDALFATIRGVRRELDGRRWITEGRGPYEYDDDRYRAETGYAFDAIRDIVEKAAQEGRQRFDAIMNPDERAATDARVAALVTVTRALLAEATKLAPIKFPGYPTSIAIVLEATEVALSAFPPESPAAGA